MTTNISIIDFWTVYHIIVTFLMGIIGRKIFKKKRTAFALGFLIIASWETIESTSILAQFGLFTESLVNKTADVIIGIIFLYLGLYLNPKKAFKWFRKK